MPRFLRLPEHNPAAGTRSPQKQRRAPGQRQHGQLPLTDFVIRLVLSQVACDLLQGHRRGGDGLRRILRALQLGAQRIPSIFKCGDRVHRRPPFLMTA